MPEKKSNTHLPKRLSVWLEPKNFMSVEFEKNSYGEFLKQRMVTHLRVNRAIIDSIPNHHEQINGKPGTSVRDILETETIDMIKKKIIADNKFDYPNAEDLKLLTDHQLSELQYNLASDSISKSKSPETDMLFFDVQFARQTGLLIKYLDYFGLKRPDRLIRVWGDGKYQDPKETETGKVELWFQNDSPNVNTDSYPEDIKPIVESIIDQSYVNEKRFQDIPPEYRRRNIKGRPHSSADADLRHQVINLANQIDKTTNIAHDYFKIPSEYEIYLMKYDYLISLYRSFTTHLVRIFGNREVQDSTIDWYGQQLNAKEFLTKTFEHVMLHQGSLQVFYDQLN